MSGSGTRSEPAAGRIDQAGEYIREHYDVPAHVNGRILFTWRGKQPGTIVGFCGSYLRVKFDGERGTALLHPTWMVDYLAERFAPTTAPEGERNGHG